MRHVTTATLLLALAACGGSDGGNAAIGKTFSYGAPGPLSTTQASTLQASLEQGFALASAPDPAAAELLSDSTSLTSALVGDGASLGFLVAPSTPERALMMASRDVGAERLAVIARGTSYSNPGCVVATATTLTLAGCSLTVSDDGGSETRITADGAASVSGGTLDWDFTVGVTMTGSGFSMSARASRDGTLTATSSTLTGRILSQVSATASAGGRSESVAVSESVTLDLLYTSTPACITSGELEAKRVWTQRPSGADGPDYADRGALVSWSGCGVAEIALSR